MDCPKFYKKDNFLRNWAVIFSKHIFH